MSDRIKTIVAGVSQPNEGDPTLVAAAALARWTGAALHLVQAYTIPPVFSPPQLGYTSPEWTQHYADHIADRLEATAHRVPGAESAVCHAVAGTPAQAILETAAQEGADLVVVGAAGADRLGGRFLGTTAQRVLRGADVPVLILRRPLRRPLRRVLLTSDLSELSAAVHEEGLDTAAAVFGAPLALRSLLVLFLPLVGPSLLPREVLERAALEELEDFLQARRRHAVAVEPVVRVGVAPEEIAAEAEDWQADLLVVGTHARGWAARLMLGSVAEAALRDAPCNVLAVPPRAVALGEPAAASEPAGESAAEAGRLAAASA
ncbi:MAG TPA: universal stress protein [Longimicrobium sp.]|nr:universal stress protein [Longimicrobium sp.]